MTLCDRCGGRVYAELGDESCWWCARSIAPPTVVVPMPPTLDEIGRWFDAVIDVVSR